jgi:hypothetical protein
MKFTCIYSDTPGRCGGFGCCLWRGGGRRQVEPIHDAGLNRLSQWGASGIVACRNSPGYVIRVIDIIRSGAGCCVTGREAHHEFESAHATGRHQRSHASPVCRVRRGRCGGSPDRAGRAPDVPPMGLAAVQLVRRLLGDPTSLHRRPKHQALSDRLHCLSRGGLGSAILLTLYVQHDGPILFQNDGRRRRHGSADAGVARP